MKRHSVKKILAGISSACMIAAASVPFAPAAMADDTTVTYGDANCDGEVNMADAVLIMQSIGNPDKYQLTDKGADNADVFDRGDGVTNRDALSIQKYKLGLINTLPESVKGGNEDPVTDTVYIHLSGSSITVEGDNNGCTAVSGSKVTISHSGAYYIDGTLDDGQIEVNIPDETADAETVKLFLNGASITGKSAPAILVTNAENTSINLVDGTENSISDGDTVYADAAGTATGDAVIEAKDDITIKGGELGTGILNLTANTQTGISCNNDIKFNGGVINVTTLNSTDKTDAVKGKTSVTVKDGKLTIDAEGDGIKSSKGSVAVTGGYTSIKAGNDAVQAGTTIDISGGTLIAGGDRGLTADTGVNITGGNVYATATDYQVKTELLSGTTQTTALLNCIDDATNEKDGMWKKVNAISSSADNKVEFTKKYKYVLISETSMNGAKSCGFTNLGTGAAVTHTDGTQKQFQLGLVSVFESVDPSGAGSSTVVTPPVVSDGLTITLSGSDIQTNAPADTASASNGVVTITKPGVFAVSGTGTGTQIVVDVDKTAYPDGVVELDLVGVDMTNTTTAPIYVASIGDEVQIVAKKDTVNTISDGTSHTQTYTDSDGNSNTVEGAVFSRDDIKFKGAGTLTVNGNQDDAIVCKNDIKIFNGTINVNAVDDGIRGKDSVTVGDATKADGSAADNSGLTLTVKTTTGDGIKSTATDTATDKSYGVVTVNGGTVNITSFGDGIQGEQDVVINGGTLNITTTGTGNDSAKGIKSVGLYDAAGTTRQSGGTLTVNGGLITVNSKDDCLHCGGDAVLNAGKLKLTSGDDAVHSDNALYIGGKTAGTDYTSLEVYVTACYEGMEAVYIYQNNGNIYIISKDDGYNAAGGADSSGGNNNTGFNQGGRPGGGGFPGGMSSTYGEMYLNGGIVSVNTSFQDADGFDSNGNIVFNGGYYFGNGGDSFDCGDGGYTITRNGGYAFGGLGMNGGSGYDMSTQMVFATSDGTVLATSMSGSRMSYAYGDSNVVAYSGAEVTGGENISTLGQPAIYISGKVSGGTAKALGSGSSSQQPGGPGFGF
ncbi:MAG: carbohydrate-binding domain-containing protein [Ruminococcus sp.]|nr:carbohydrate-binding domain-containing protein [Ruminococcus sp.]